MAYLKRLEADNNSLRVENEKLRLAGNAMAVELDRGVKPTEVQLLLRRWREALR